MDKQPIEEVGIQEDQVLDTGISNEDIEEVDRYEDSLEDVIDQREADVIDLVDQHDNEIREATRFVDEAVQQEANKEEE